MSTASPVLSNASPVLSTASPVLSNASPVLSRRDRGAVAYVTLERPTAGNSLSGELIRALQAEFDRLMQDRSKRVVVLCGSGSRIFCAGHDLAEFQQHDDPAFHEGLSRECSTMMQTIRRLPQIVIARVDGIATAAGCQLVAAADLALASDRSRFATPGVNIGFWCWTPMVPISRSIAPKHALRMLATGEMLSAQSAVAIGLVNEIHTADTLDAEIDRLADLIASKSGHSLASGKAGFWTQLEMTEPQAYDYVCDQVRENIAHPDAKEGIQAFLEKRPPVWSNPA
ncbi:enoyl-CoA hydratase [Quisquiliibacterium transsilvanicum]|uniref:Enoyl-CoA hydratase domain-containing protein 3, mitochondrial n=1 Tax=Quisquiliibacterium transsilvanicum TaxID=1549638 RepID=A0A7W8M9S1_9BURK|nr:enoyl-CoA hydratase [Quisquiliibacterium transsilvanicum]MBB5272907.1 enoyl-CoA hydratase/carnithine racemase [Quisquiliibacterium transsilvanicum]